MSKKFNVIKIISAQRRNSKLIHTGHGRWQRKALREIGKCVMVWYDVN